MADVSNKTLAFLLVGAIILSLFGTLISLNRLGRMAPPIITGLATSGQGTASVEIASALSIQLITSTVNFGTCNQNASRPVGYADVIDSNDTSKAGSGEGQCSGLTNPQNISIKNTGNVDANVTVQTTAWNLTGGNNQSLYFSFANASDYPGCYKGTAYPTWTNFTLNNTDYMTCQNITSVVTGDHRIWVLFRIHLPQNAEVGARSAILTFTARNVQ